MKGLTNEQTLALLQAAWPKFRERFNGKFINLYHKVDSTEWRERICRELKIGVCPEDSNETFEVYNLNNETGHLISFERLVTGEEINEAIIKCT